MDGDGQLSKDEFTGTPHSRQAVGLIYVLPPRAESQRSAGIGVTTDALFLLLLLVVIAVAVAVLAVLAADSMLDPDYLRALQRYKQLEGPEMTHSLKSDSQCSAGEKINDQQRTDMFCTEAEGALHELKLLKEHEKELTGQGYTRRQAFEAGKAFVTIQGGRGGSRCLANKLHTRTRTRTCTSTTATR